MTTDIEFYRVRDENICKNKARSTVPGLIRCVHAERRSTMSGYVLWEFPHRRFIAANNKPASLPINLSTTTTIS